MTSRLRETANVSGVAPEFTVDPRLLDAISPSSERGGIVLGAGASGEPLAISALRSTPTRIALIGGLFLARQFALRTLAVGAWVVVATGRDPEWHVIQRAAGSGPDGQPSQHVQIRRPSPVELPRASEDSPLVVILDDGPTPQDMFPPRSPWHTTVYVMPYLHPQASSIVNAADIVLIQRMAVGQAELAGRLWNLPPHMSRHLSTLSDNQVVALGHGLWQPIQLVTTASEQQLLGPIRRGD